MKFRMKESCAPTFTPNGQVIEYNFFYTQVSLAKQIYINQTIYVYTFFLFVKKNLAWIRCHLDSQFVILWITYY